LKEDLQRELGRWREHEEMRSRRIFCREFVVFDRTKKEEYQYQVVVPAANTQRIA
jgi:hypothetical protein